MTGKKLFLGARVSVPVANALGGCAETLARRARDAGLDVRWVAPVNYHLTLKYLGWTREEMITAVATVVAQAVAGVPRLAWKTARLGAFKSLDKATVVWAGVTDNDGALAKVATAIDRAVHDLGYPLEARPFHPHVTLGRIREPRSIRELVLPLAEQMFGDSKVDAITLFESEQNNQENNKMGAKVSYREVARIELNQPLEARLGASERQRETVELATSTNPSADPSSDTDDGWPRGQGPMDS